MEKLIGKPGRTGRQGLALLLFIVCPLVAFTALQQGNFFITGVCMALLGLAFVITITSR